MDNWKDGAMTALEARTYLYQVFQTVFGANPNEQIMDMLTDDFTIQAIELLEMEGLPAYGRAAAFLQDIRGSLHEAGFMERLKEEYTRLFIGPAKLPAPPWESVYMTRERLLFQPCTLKVRAFYMKHGLLPKDYPHVADDHLALELDFMFRMCERASSFLKEGETEKALEILSEQQAFLEEHLLKWLPYYIEAMGEVKDTALYPELSIILLGFLLSDKESVKELMELIRVSAVRA